MRLPDERLVEGVCRVARDTLVVAPSYNPGRQVFGLLQSRAGHLDEVGHWEEVPEASVRLSASLDFRGQLTDGPESLSQRRREVPHGEALGTGVEFWTSGPT